MTHPASARRRHTTLALAALTALGALAAPSLALAAYPDKPIKLIVPFPPGGQTDTVARALSAQLTQDLGQPVIVDNKPGANTIVGTEALIREPADGYAMQIVAGSTMVLNPLLYKTLPYNVPRDLKLLSVVVDVPLIMSVPTAAPHKNVADFVKHAKANPEKVTFASTGIGSSLHLTGELFADMIGTTMVHVPYKGSAPAMMELVGGQVDVMFDAPSTAMPQIKGGKVRALAVTSKEPVSFLPGIPTVNATLPGFETGVWYGIAVRSNVPDALATQLKAAIDKALLNPALQQTFAAQGAVTHKPASMAEHQAFMARETKKWQTLIGARKISMD